MNIDNKHHLAGSLRRSDTFVTGFFMANAIAPDGQDDLTKTSSPSTKGELAAGDCGSKKKAPSQRWGKTMGRTCGTRTGPLNCQQISLQVISWLTPPATLPPPPSQWPAGQSGLAFPFGGFAALGLVFAETLRHQNLTKQRVQRVRHCEEESWSGDLLQPRTTRPGHKSYNRRPL